MLTWIIFVVFGVAGMLVLTSKHKQVDYWKRQAEAARIACDAARKACEDAVQMSIADHKRRKEFEQTAECVLSERNERIVALEQGLRLSQQQVESKQERIAKQAQQLEHKANLVQQYASACANAVKKLAGDSFTNERGEQLAQTQLFARLRRVAEKREIKNGGAV